MIFSLSERSIAKAPGASVVDRLIAAYEPECIYLFVSEARGDYGPDSDSDLLVVVSDGTPPGSEVHPVGV